MRRWQLVLFLASSGWAGAFVMHLRTRWTDDEAARTRRTERRNQLLLLSSVSMNTLGFSTLYRYARRRRGVTSLGNAF